MEGLSRLEVQGGGYRDSRPSMGGEAARERWHTCYITGKHIGWMTWLGWDLMVQEREYEVTEVAERKK